MIFFVVTGDSPFVDKYMFYRFSADTEPENTRGGCAVNTSQCWTLGLPSPEDEREADEKCAETLTYLAASAPDAIMRLILRKPSYERTTDDLEMIYEELLHIKALAHLSHSVKRELAGVIVFECRGLRDGSGVCEFINLKSFDEIFGFVCEICEVCDLGRKPIGIIVQLVS